MSFYSNLSPNNFCSTALSASKPFHNFRNATLYLNKLFCTQTKAEVPGSRQNPKLTLNRYCCKLQEFLSVLRIRCLTFHRHGGYHSLVLRHCFPSRVRGPHQKLQGQICQFTQILCLLTNWFAFTAYSLYKPDT